MNLFENLLNMGEVDSNVNLKSKKIKTESSTNDKLWYKFDELFEGFIPLEDLTNYFSLDQFGEFVQWLRHEADMDYDYDKIYRNWDEVFKDLYDATGLDDTDSISMENVFNFFTTTDLEDFWEWIEKEHGLDDEMYESKKIKTEAVSTEDVYRRIEYIRDALDTLESFVNKESSIPDNIGNILKQIYHLVDYIYEYTDTMKEATSGIGGAYTTKAIDMIPINESISRQKMINELKEYFVSKDDLGDYIFSHLSDEIIKNLYDEFVEYMEFEPNSIEEATSSIGGAYTTKTIDMIPTGVKKVNENLYDEYLERVMDEKSNVELVNLLHEIRDNKKLKAEDKKKLEDEIRTKVRSIKTEAITEFYGKEWSDEEIKKAVEVAKENPDIVGYIDPNECASPFNYDGKTYYTVGEGKEIVFDGKYSLVYLTVDDELNRYLSYFEVSYTDDGDGESGPQELTMDFVSDVPFKVVEV